MKMHEDYCIVAWTRFDIGVFIAPSSNYNDSKNEGKDTHEKDQITPERPDCLISLPVVVHSFVSI